MNGNKKPLREIIYSQLVDDIVYGRINPGEKLVESELSDRFHVSRTPIREVFLQLEKAGYISLTKNIGAVVKRISTRKVKEVFSLVAQLEGYATEIFSQEKLNEKDINYLIKLQEAMEDSVAAKDYFSYVQKNFEFHKFFVNRCGNETLQEIVSDLRQMIYKLVSEGLTLPMNVDTYITSHRNIMEAISSGSPSKAGHLMKNHVLDAMGFLIDIMKKRDKYNL